MTFVQVEFLVFLALVLGLYWLVPLRGGARRVWQNVVLLLGSVVFYGWVHPWMVGLLAFSTLLDYGVGRGMAARPDRKGALLALSLAGNLGMLALFKYHDWFAGEVAQALGSLGVQVHPWTLGLALPVGISFYTFQTLSYTIDVYRGRLAARRNLLDHAVFVSMFPQLVAGPVERARDLLPQVEGQRSWSWARARSGVGLALWGAFKKVVIADTVALHVDRAFAVEGAPPVLLWAAAAGFMVQILADFSGYTDIARGTARLLGFELVQNFRHPYRASSPSDFWRRWHISFSSWIHEYLYIPLGGNRKGELRRILATFGALLLSGLWHGASWNFVLWGAYHAVLLVVWRAGARVLPRVPGLGVVAMLGFTLVGWMLFRQGDLGVLAATFSAPPWAGGFDGFVGAAIVGSVAAAGGLGLLLGGIAEDHLPARLRRATWGLPLETLLWSLALAGILLFARDTARDFIYFRF